MFEDMKKFKGDFTSLWKLDVLPPIPRLSWWWWWVIIYIPDQQNPVEAYQNQNPVRDTSGRKS